MANQKKLTPSKDSTDSIATPLKNSTDSIATPLKDSTDSIAQTLSNDKEIGQRYREDILKRIKDIGKEEKKYKRLSAIRGIIHDELAQKNIPTEYKQKIIDEISLLGGFEAIAYCQNIFEGAHIEECVYNTLIMDGKINLDYIRELRYRKTYNPTKLIDLIITIERNEDKNKTENIEKTIDKIIETIIYNDGNNDGNNEKNNKETLIEVINKLLNSEYFYIIPEIQRTLRRRELEICLSNDDNEKLANKLIENNQFSDVFKMLKGTDGATKLEPSDDKFFENLETKLINHYDNMEDKNEKEKEIKEHAQYYDLLPESSYKKLRVYFLDINPYEFLSKLGDFPGDPLNDNEILEKLAKKILSIRTNSYYIKYLHRLIDVEPMIFDKYADKIIEESKEYGYGYWNIFDIEFNGKIDYLEKIKKLIKYQKSRGNEKIFEVITDKCTSCNIDKEKLANIFETEGEDITKYPRFFSKVLYNRDHKNIELLLKTFHKATKYEDGYKVRNKNGYVGFVKDGEIIFEGTDEHGFDKHYKKYKRNLPINETISSLKEEGHIRTIITYNKRDSVQIKLPNGKIGTAHSSETHDTKRNKDVEILDEHRKHLSFIKGPKGTTNTIIASGKDTLYVGSYSNNNSYITAYNTHNFNKKWEISLNNSMINSIDIINNKIIAYDEKNNKIECFDTTNGEQIERKDNYLKEEDKSDNIKFHNGNLATSYIISEIPGLEEGFEKGITFRNEHFGSTLLDFMKPKCIAVDTKNKRVYQSNGDNYIEIFDKTGLIGILPFSNALNINFDHETNCLIISRYGDITIFDEKALDKIIEESSKILNKVKNKQ